MLSPDPVASNRPPPDESTIETELSLAAAAGRGARSADPELVRRLAENSEVYAGWATLVGRIRSSQTDGMAELYHLFSKGVRFYLCRQLGVQDLDDRVHDTFVVVVQAIRRGELREPERLMGFVRTIVRRQVASHIDKAVQTRREQLDLDASSRVADPHGNPEEAAIFHQKGDLIRKVLSELTSRDREILTRFYLEEETQEEIWAIINLTHQMICSILGSWQPNPRHFKTLSSTFLTPITAFPTSWRIGRNGRMAWSALPADRKT